MPRMIDLIRNSAVPATIMRTASKGALALPGEEMVEILVYLSSHAIFREQARMTLAAWDENSAVRICADPTTPFEVIEYYLDPRNRRPKLVPALLENSSIPELDLLEMAQEPLATLIAQMLESPRVLASSNILHALQSNPALTPPQQVKIDDALRALGETIAGRPVAATPAASVAAELAPEHDEEVAKYIAEHAHEIAAEEGKAFELAHDETGELTEALKAASTAAAAASAPAAATAAPQAKPVPAEGEQGRESPLQRISKLTVGQRIQLAMKGNKEERFILIRDGAKLVSSAVLESSKLTDQEAETFAGMKNVQESVLRGIASKRKFMKQYNVVRALVNNPRCPLDVSLTLIKNLLPNDLKGVSMNKNVPETLRKVGLKMFKGKTEKKD